MNTEITLDSMNYLIDNDIITTNLREDFNNLELIKFFLFVEMYYILLNDKSEDDNASLFNEDYLNIKKLILKYSPKSINFWINLSELQEYYEMFKTHTAIIFKESYNRVFKKESFNSLLNKQIKLNNNNNNIKQTINISNFNNTNNYCCNQNLNDLEREKIIKQNKIIAFNKLFYLKRKFKKVINTNECNKIKNKQENINNLCCKNLNNNINSSNFIKIVSNIKNKKLSINNYTNINNCKIKSLNIPDYLSSIFSNNKELNLNFLLRN